VSKVPTSKDTASANIDEKRSEIEINTKEGLKSDLPSRSMQSTPAKGSPSSILTPSRAKTGDVDSPMLSSTSVKPEKKKGVPESKYTTPNNGGGFVKSSDWIKLGRMFKHKAEQEGRKSKTGAVYHAAAMLCFFTKQSLTQSDYLAGYDSNREYKDFTRNHIENHGLKKVLSIQYIMVDH
jgi:hypothetical protein